MNHIKFLSFIFLLFLIVFIGCKESSKKPKNNSQQEFLKQSLFVIKNVNIIPMTVDNAIIENAMVIIENKKIVDINGLIPIGATIIDGKGKWLIPGLIDMHVHTNTDGNFRKNTPTQGATLFMDTQNVMTPHIANGVTTIFELAGRVEHFAQRNEIAKGKVIGPRMAIAALINGGDPNDRGRIVNNASDARQAVRSIKAEGYSLF